MLTDFQVKKVYVFFLMLLSPLLTAFYIFKEKSERLIIFWGSFLFGFFGLVFVYTEGIDAYTHLENVKEYYINMDFNEFARITFNIVTLTRNPDGPSDLYLHLLSYLSGAILGIPELLHIFSGLILGYFFTKSAVLVLRKDNQVRYIYMLLFLSVIFLSVRSVSALNSIRYWTGVWVFFYGFLKFCELKRIKYIFIILSCAMIHIGLIPIIIMGIAGAFLNNYKKMILAIFISSFFISSSLALVSDYMPQNEVLLEKQYTYESSSAGVENLVVVENNNFYKKYGFIVYKTFSIPFLILTLVLSGIYFKPKESIIDKLLVTGILMVSLSNFVATIPELASRSFQSATIFLVTACIFLIKNNFNLILNKSQQRIFSFGMYGFFISAIPFVMFHFSYAINSLSIFLIGFPMASVILGDNDISIVQAIKLLIF